MPRKSPFKHHRFPRDIILCAVRWYLCLGPLKLYHYLLTKGVAENGTETIFG